MADVSILDKSVAAAPKAYTIAGALEIVLKSVTASFDGTSSATAYVPAVQIVDPSGFIVGTYTLGQSLPAGAAADVSWFPGIGGAASTNAGGVQQVPLYISTPNQGSTAYPALSTNNGFSNFRNIVPSFQHGQDGTWNGSLLIPGNYSSGATIVLPLVANANTGAVRMRVATAVVASGQSEDTTLTAEAYVNTTVPGTALRRFDVSFVLSTTLAPGASLNVQVTRNGSSGSDTLAVDVLMWHAILQYLPS